MTEAESDVASDHHTRASKIERVIDRYGLEGLGDRLVELWTGEGDERLSLRDLSDLFNRRVLRAAMESADMRPLDGEVENTYRLLTDDDVSEGMRQQTRSRMERNGVDVDALERHFVSHQAVYTYLKEYRNVSHSSNDGEEKGAQIDRGADTINALISRTTAVTEDMLERLMNSEEIERTEISVFVDVRVTCESCGRTMTVNEFLSEKGCHCVGSP